MEGNENIITRTYENGNRSSMFINKRNLDLLPRERIFMYTFKI